MHATGRFATFVQSLVESVDEKELCVRAVIMDSKGSVHIANRPNPTLPGPQGAIVAVEATGICGSDLHFTTAICRRSTG